MNVPYTMRARAILALHEGIDTADALAAHLGVCTRTAYLLLKELARDNLAAHRPRAKGRGLSWMLAA